MKLIFYKSKEHKNHYFIYKAREATDPVTMFQKITHTGEFENSGYAHAEIELGFSMTAETNESFIDYLIENVATNHIPNSEYDNATFRSWYEFKDVDNKDKWLNDFYEFQKKRHQEYNKANGISVQTTLF